MNEDARKITIEIDNLTEAQVIALEDMLYTWQAMGNAGCSRWTAFYADGDGNFRPKIKIDGRDPKPTDFVKKEQKWRKDDDKIEADYTIDFDWIAWKLRDKSEE